MQNSTLIFSTSMMEDVPNGTPNPLFQRTESLFLPLLVECLTYGRMRQYCFPRSVETERQKGLNTERQNDRIQKYKKQTLSKAKTSACFKLSFERPVSQLVPTRAVSELVSDKDKQTITS